MIKPNIWSDEETLLYEQELRLVVSTLSKATDYSVKELRTLYMANKLSLKPHVQEAMHKLLELETEFLAAHIKLCFAYCRSYAKTYRSSIPDMDYDDYVQEASGAILNAVYSYARDEHFTTYATFAYKNKVKEVVRSKLKKLNKLQIEAGKVKQQVESGMLAEDVIEAIPDIETRVGVRNLLGRRVDVSKLIDLASPSSSKEEKDMLELVKEILPEMMSEMTNIELNILGCFMQGKKISSLTRLINPNANTFYTFHTRQSLSQTFKRLKMRLKEQILEKV